MPTEQDAQLPSPDATVDAESGDWSDDDEPQRMTIVAAAPDEGQRLDRALAAHLPDLSRTYVQSLIEGGQVTVEGRQRKVSHRLREGEHIEVLIPPPLSSDLLPEAIPLVIVYEDADVIVIDKPAGLVVHPAPGHERGTVVNALLGHDPGMQINGSVRPGIVHRIDKDTSGLMVAAKTDLAHEGLAKQFARHSIDRRYLAIVAGIPTPPSGSVDAPLARSTANRQKMAVVRDGRGKRAVTHYRLVEPLRQAALVECRLETGRTHQVRVHMSSIGHPLLGDPVYGRGKIAHRDLLNQLDFNRQALHAALIGFVHPVSKENLSFKSAIPSDMQELFSALAV